MLMSGVGEKIDSLFIEKRAFIDGCYVAAVNGDVISKVSPVDGRDLTGVAACDQEDVNFAVAAALQSFDKGEWANKLPRDKKRILLAFADLIELHREELALLDTVETGRAYQNYYDDSIPKAIEALRYFAESVDKLYDSAVTPGPEAFSTIVREPLGVVALITPWNDPMVVSMWKIAPALLMGNSIVIKPAEQSSFSILRVAALAKEAGIPAGVFNVVPGHGEVAGKALALHRDVSGIFFTGSSETGKKMLEYSGQSNMKKVALECGGKSAFLVSKHCSDLEVAARTLADSMFYNQGQICSAPSRAIIAEEVKDEFISILLTMLDDYVPADPFNPENSIGCVVSAVQQGKINQYIDEGVASGLKVYRSRPAKGMSNESCYVLPAVFVDDNEGSPIAQEEIFGPVLLVMGATTMREAVRKANNTRYGLAASIWTNDLNEAHWVSRNLRAGIVHVNCYGDDDNTAPFGGIKESGIGKDKSIFAFDDYSELKTVWVRYEPSFDAD